MPNYLVLLFVCVADLDILVAVLGRCVVLGCCVVLENLVVLGC